MYRFLSMALDHPRMKELRTKRLEKLILTIYSLENDIIVLRGPENEASSQLLKGVVVLCLHAALKVEDVHLKLSGQLKVGYEHIPHHPIHEINTSFYMRRANNSQME